MLNATAHRSRAMPYDSNKCQHILLESDIATIVLLIA